jgi:hypothetical protein
MCPTNPQKGLKRRKGDEPFSGTESGIELLESIGAREGSSEHTPYALLLAPYDKKLSYALCALLYDIF